MTEIPICGFDTAYEGMCREPRAETPGTLRCVKHDDVRFKVCVGCAGVAYQECKAEIVPAGKCSKPVCLSCTDGWSEGRGTHHAPGAHQPVPLDTRSAPGRVAGDVRKELIAVLAASLVASEERSLVSFPGADYATRVAGVAIDALTTHITLKVLSGLAGAQE